MIVILKVGFDGESDSDPPRDRRCSLRVKEDVGIVEHDSTIQARREGFFKLEYEPFENPEDGTPGQRATGIESFLGQKVWVSPLLGDFSIEEFPENWSFGNAAGGPHNVVINREINGLFVRQIRVTVVTFPWGTDLTPEQLYELQLIYEGSPPGTLDRNMWREFDAEGRAKPGELVSDGFIIKG